MPNDDRSLEAWSDFILNRRKSIKKSRPIASFSVEVFAGPLNELGLERLADALNDAKLEDAIHDFVLDELNKHLPAQHENDEPVDWFSVSVAEN